MCNSTHSLTVQAGHGRTVAVKAGQFLTNIDGEGQQAADFVAVVARDKHEKLSPTHTRRKLNSIFF
ncbi:DUF1989 domain-containing protein, partial [Acinetobacter baumannii]